MNRTKKMCYIVIQQQKNKIKKLFGLGERKVEMNWFKEIFQLTL